MGHAGCMLGTRLYTFGGWGGAAGSRELQSRMWVLETSTWRWRRAEADRAAPVPWARKGAILVPYEANSALLYGGDDMGEQTAAAAALRRRRRKPPGRPHANLAPLPPAAAAAEWMGGGEWSAGGEGEAAEMPMQRHVFDDLDVVDVRSQDDVDGGAGW